MIEGVIMEKNRILIVNSPKDEYDFLKNVFREQFSCLESDGYVQTLKILKSKPNISLVIFYLSENESELPEFFEMINSDSDICSVPIIAWSSEYSSMAEETALRLGADDYFSYNCSEAAIRLRAEKAIKKIPYNENYDKERKTGKMMNQLINMLPGGIAIYKVGNDIETLYFSDGLPKLSGYSYNEYMDYTQKDVINNIVYKDDRHNLMQSIKKSSVIGESLNITFRINHRDGGFVWVQLSAVRIYEEDGCPIYYAVFVKPTEESAMYKRIVEESTIGVLIAEKSSRRVLYGNNSLKKLMNMPLNANVIGKKIQKIISPKYMFFTNEELKSLSSEKYENFHKETSKGRYINVSARSVIWNNIESYICYLTDETELRTNSIQLQQMLDYVPSGVGMFEISNGSAKQIYLNDGYYRLVFDTRENRNRSNNGNFINSIYPDDRDSIAKAIKKLENGYDSVDLNFRSITGSGGNIWLRLIASITERSENKAIIYCSFSSIADVVNTRQALEQNKIMLEAAVNSANMIVWEYDIKGKYIVQTSDSMKSCGLGRITPNIPESLIESGYIMPDSVNRYRKLFSDFCLNGELVSGDFHINNGKDTIWERIILTPFYDSEGTLTKAIGTSLVITEQKEREYAYEEQMRLKRVLTTNVLAIALCNLTQNSVAEAESSSPYLMKIMKSGTVDDFISIINENTVSVLETEIMTSVPSRKYMIEAYRKGENHISIRHYLNDIENCLESSFDLVTNPYTGDTEAIVILNDINDEVYSEQIVKKLIQADYDSIFTIDAQTGKPKSFAQSQIDSVIDEQKKVGNFVKGVESYLRKNCINTDIERVINETSLSYVRKALESEPVHITMYTLNINGKNVHKRAAYSYIGKEKKTILCAVQDLTVTYEQEEKQKRQLENALQTAMKANQAKTEFLSRMSHDIRTPMNAIIGMTELAKDEKNYSNTMEYLQNIDDASHFLLGLINDILDVSKMESGEIELHPEAVSLDEFKRSIDNVIRPLMDAKHIDFVFQMGCGATCILIDKLRFNQIFFNLLTNAAKFTHEGGRVEFLAEKIPNKGDKHGSRFIIRDNGIGMSKEFIPHIYEAFSQEKTGENFNLQGTGLGLPIVKSLVDAMGGSIQVKSEQGKGTEFIVDMYLTITEKKEDNEIVENSKTDFLSGSHIMLVEDNELNIIVAKRLIEKKNCIVETAVNGKKAVELFEKSAVGYFDAILMDVRMPIMNGIDATRAIRSLDKKDALTVSIIAMTADAFNEDKLNTIESGMNAHLSKPIVPDLLYAALEKYIEIKRNADK